MNIREIFYKGQEENKSNIIRTVDVNWKQNSAGIIRLAKHFEPNFKLTKENDPILTILLLYFTGDKRFETEYSEYMKRVTGGNFGVSGSLSKGILLIGSVGTGKTLLMRIFKEYTMEILKANSYKMYDSIDIIDDVNTNGVSTLSEFGDRIMKDTNKPQPITCYIDDIAAKNETVNNYGTKVSVMDQLLTNRYNVFQRHRKLTHASSNLSPKQMLQKEVYDERIVDRINEMFNPILMLGESFRKPK